MARKWRRGANKITGFSTPFGGVQWEPATLDGEVARTVLTFFEDRRVLFAPHRLETNEHSVNSVLEIRHFLTKILVAGGISEELYNRLDKIRIACQIFMSRLGITAYGDPSAAKIIMNMVNRSGRRRHLDNELERLRKIVREQLRSMIAEYKLKPQGPLAKALGYSDTN